MTDEAVASTVENFASRIRRKLKEQEAAQSQSSKAAAERQQVILKAMISVRKALTEASKLSLGERFFLELDVSDHEGWPRLELRLVDSLAPDLHAHSLIASAHDRNDLGTVQLHLLSGEVLGRVHLNDPSEFAKLPLLLKKCMRQFLDLVAHSVLNPKSAQESLEVQTKAIETSYEEPDRTGLGTENVFTEEGFSGSNDNRAEVLDSPLPILPIGLSGKLQPC